MLFRSAVALGRYTLSLGTPDHPPRVYLNFESDYISLSRAEIAKRCDGLWERTADTDRIRHLAVSYWGYDRFSRLPPLWRRLTALGDIMMVRSVRWQYGRVPGRAEHDFAAWSAREKRAEGITHWFAERGEDGAVTIHDGKRTISQRDLALNGLDRWLESSQS